MVVWPLWKGHAPPIHLVYTGCVQLPAPAWLLGTLVFVAPALMHVDIGPGVPGLPPGCTLLVNLDLVCTGGGLASAEDCPLSWVLLQSRNVNAHCSPPSRICAG